jgi:hypothetical protein
MAQELGAAFGTAALHMDEPVPDYSHTDKSKNPRFLSMLKM